MDCPRAETMMSFRRATDSTYIAQLLGRMVRTPLQMHINVDDSLNDVRLYLPYFNRENVAVVINELQESWAKMTNEEKKAYRQKLDILKNEMCEYFLKIINGRINSFRLRSNGSLKNHEDINDIVQDAFIAVMTYINRYNDELATSAFAYVTQLATNSILFSLNEIKEREQKMVTGLDFYDNLNTIDDPHSMDGINKFVE